MFTQSPRASWIFAALVALLAVTLGFCGTAERQREARTEALAKIDPIMPVNPPTKLKAEDLLINQSSVQRAGGIVQITLPIPDGRGGHIQVHRFLTVPDARLLSEQLQAVLD